MKNKSMGKNKQYTMTGAVSTSISFEIETLNEIDNICNELNMTRSRWVHLASRHMINLHPKINMLSLASSLSRNDKKELLEIIKRDL